jgi:tetratricopeptide (TPR) repeat protein
MPSVSGWLSLQGSVGFRDLYPYLVIAVAAFLVFGGTLAHDLVWDDEDVIYHAREVVNERGLAGLGRVAFTARPDAKSEKSGYYRPVSLISMWVNDPVGRPSPFLYHLANVVLHIINSLLVFALFRLVCPEGLTAFLGGIIFAVHPVHAESVAWVSGRTDLLAALFIFLAIIFQQRTHRLTGFSHAAFYTLGMISFALACLSKETAFFLPVFAVLWTIMDRYRHSRTADGNTGPGISWVIGWFAVLGLIIFIREGLFGIGMGPEVSSRALPVDAGSLAMIGEVLKNLAVYLRVLSFPWPLEVYYPPTLPVLTPFTTVVSVGFVVICLLFSGKRHRYVGLLALVWVLIFLGPVSGILSLGLSAVAERFCYLPSVGFALLSGYVLGLWSGRSSLTKGYTVVVGGLIVLFAAGSVLHASRWKDDVVLFENAVIGRPVSVPNMYFNLGNAYVETGAFRKGIMAFEEAIREHPHYIKARINLAAAHIALSEHEIAVEVLSRTEKLAPDEYSLWSNKAIALEMLGRTEESLAAYTMAAGLNPNDTVANIHRGNLLYRRGRFKESATTYRMVREIDSDHFGALIGLGRSFEGMNMLKEAGETYLTAVEERQEDPAGYQGLGRVLLGQGRAQEAVVVYEMALDLDNPTAAVHRGLVLALHQAGRTDDARQHILSLTGVDLNLARQLTDLVDDLDRERAEKEDLP